MSSAVLEAHVRALMAASPGPPAQFVWHGGEPTPAGVDLYRRAVELQRRFLPPNWGCSNSPQSNGTLLDDEWRAFLAEQRLAVGISIDDPARLHDARRRDRRGRSGHARAIRGLHLLRKRGIDSDVLCTLNARTPRRARRASLPSRRGLGTRLAHLVASPRSPTGIPEIDVAVPLTEG